MMTTVIRSYNFDRFLKEILDNFKSCAKVLNDENFSYEWKLGTFQTKSLSKGGFGLVSNISVNNKKIVTHSGKDVVVKSNKNSIQLTFSVIEGIFAVDYDVSEIYFATLLSYITRLKICPFICKYLSVNLVDEEYMLFIEKYESELLTFPKLSVERLINFLFQLTYTVYILKIYLGFVHFDVHLRNVMITKSNRSFMIVDKSRGIYLPEMDYEIRLIDFGLCLADLTHSVDPFLRKPVKIAPINFNVTKEKLPELYFTTKNNVSKLLTIELQYFMLHIYQLTKRAQGEHHPICKTIEDFGEAMYGTKVNFNYPSLGPNNVILSEHDVGVTCELNHPEMLMNGLVNYCQKHGSVFHGSVNVRYSPFKKYNFDTKNMHFLRAEANIDIRQKYQRFIKQDIPLVPWYENSFYSLGTQFGNRLVFPMPLKLSLSKDKQDTCLHITSKNAPFSSSNAYVTFEDNKIQFVRKTNANADKQLFFCGHFLWVSNKSFVVKEHAKLVLGITKNNFFIFYFQKALSEKYLLKIIKEHELELLINVTNSLGFSYKGDILHNPSKTRLFYINL